MEEKREAGRFVCAVPYHYLGSLTLPEKRCAKEVFDGGDLAREAFVLSKLPYEREDQGDVGFCGYPDPQQHPGRNREF